VALGTEFNKANGHDQCELKIQIWPVEERLTGRNEAAAQRHLITRTGAASDAPENAVMRAEVNNVVARWLAHN
jgi:hypothetical protein